MKTQNQSRRQRAFTLVELLVAMSIVILLAAASLGGYKYATTRQAYKKAEIQIQLLSNALEDYKLDKGAYPPSDAGSTTPIFEALWNTGNASPDTDKIYLSELDPANNKQGWINGTGTEIIDPWGRPYIYRSPGTINPDFDLISMGPDGETSDNRSNSENKDDVTN